MVYRILTNDLEYLSLIYDDEEVIEKLGEENLIQIECDPREYEPLWQTLSVSASYEPQINTRM